MGEQEGKILFDDQYEYLGKDARGMYVFKHKRFGDLIYLIRSPRFKRKGTNQVIHLDPNLNYYYEEM